MEYTIHGVPLAFLWLFLVRQICHPCKLILFHHPPIHHPYISSFFSHFFRSSETVVHRSRIKLLPRPYQFGTLKPTIIFPLILRIINFLKLSIDQIEFQLHLYFKSLALGSAMTKRRLTSSSLCALDIYYVLTSNCTEEA